MELDEEILITYINELRNILNEMCCTIGEDEVGVETLTVSRQLDQLIVEYMVLKKQILQLE